MEDKHINAEELEENANEISSQSKKIDFSKINQANFWNQLWDLFALYIEWFALYFDITETIPPQKEEIVEMKWGGDFKIKEGPPQKPQEGYFAQFKDEVDRMEELEEFDDDDSFSDEEFDEIELFGEEGRGLD